MAACASKYIRYFQIQLHLNLPIVFKIMYSFRLRKEHGQTLPASFYPIRAERIASKIPAYLSTLLIVLKHRWKVSTRNCKFAMSFNSKEVYERRVCRARQSFAATEGTVKGMLRNEKDYDDVLDALVRNTKVGPFLSTSGVELPCYLNASTNFIDKHIAPTITRMLLDVLSSRFQGAHTEDKPLLVVGMETAGGIMVAQLAATAALHTPHFVPNFIYCRKSKKKTGTCQQLEGPQFLTNRSSGSPRLKCVYLDDVNSTGSSLRDAIKFLKEEYNIVVQHALYLVDRSCDRSDMELKKIGLMDGVVDDVNIFSLFDYDMILGRLPKAVTARRGSRKRKLSKD